MSSNKWGQEQFFQFANKIIGDTFKGTFTIKQVKNRWFWYYKFSNNKISPRTKYLCSCDVELEKSQTSFQHANQIFLEKINHNFSNKNVIEPLLSKYIKEYIEICIKDGGLEYKKRGSHFVLTYNDDIETKRNIGTMKRRVITLNEFNLFCIEKKIKTNVQATRKNIIEGNKEVHAKNSAIPEGARILTENQYDDQMSFVLKH